MKMKLLMRFKLKQAAILAVLLFTAFIPAGFSQSMGIASTAITPDASSILELRSTSKGFLAPRMLAAERTAIASPAAGLMVYQTDGTAGFYYYNGASWINIGASFSGSLSGDVSGTQSATVVGKINGTSLAGLATGILKNTTGTGVPSIAVAGDFPTLNQNTTGSAATLTTSRNIHGGSFNGSADVTNIIASTYGGTGNGFTKFTGPTTSEKTFTLPNASATILTDNATVTAAQGGTGQSSYTTGDMLYASSSSALSKLSAVSAGSYLRSAGTSTAPVWSTTTLPNSATTGDLLYASAGNTYSNLAGVATGNALISGGVSTAPFWGKIGLTTHVSGTLPVANGGTGVASTTAYGVITGGTTSTGALQNAGTGTSGQVLISNGSSALPTWQNYASGSLINVRFISSGTTYTPTSGTTKILIEMVGGGGGGGGADNKGSAGAGGGAGGYIKTWVTGISDASTYTIAIGGGGAGGVAAGGGDGTAGTATTFATLAGSIPASTTFTCNGGGGGTGSADGSTKISVAGGAGGTSTNGDISAGGAPGGWTLSRGNGEGTSSGAGGSSQFGGGGVGIVSLFGTTDLPGNAGSGNGAGGSGAYAGSGTGAIGGAGSAGIIVIYEYK